MRWRYVALACGLGAMIITVGMLAGGRIVFQFFPPVEGDQVFAKLVFPEGTPLRATEEAVERIRLAGERVRERLKAEQADGADPVEHVLVSVGSMVARGSMNMDSSSGAHFAEVAMSLQSYEERGGMTSAEVAELWREYTGEIADTTELSFTAQAFSLGKDIAIDLRGRDVEQLGAAAAEVRATLASFDGVMNITDSFMSGKQELVLKIRPEAELLGLTQADLGRQVRQAFYGEEAQRVQRGREDVRVMVRYPEDERASLGDFENMRIRLEDGTEVPVLSVADVTLSRGYSTIQRINGQRVITVTGDVNRQVISPEVVLNTVMKRELPAILAKYPGVGFALSGEAEERVAAMASIITSSTIALLVIFALLAIPLKSYLQPLVIMSSIPFGLIGALLGHFIMGYSLVFFSLLGIVALSGVVVNASLVLVDYINRRRREGASMLEAVLESGSVRFRPILLTSVTTFIGLVPLMVTANIQTGMFVPMAISLGFGVLFATAVTLLLIPALYVVLEDFLGLVQRLRREKIIAESADEQIAFLDQVGARR